VKETEKGLSQHRHTWRGLVARRPAYNGNITGKKINSVAVGPPRNLPIRMFLHLLNHLRRDSIKFITSESDLHKNVLGVF
jgi:hypothetical protein